MASSDGDSFLLNRLMLVLLLSLLSFAANAQALLTGKLQYGRHPVGFRVVETVDAGRSYLPARDYFGEPTRFPRGRPMQVAMWYPAKPGGRAHPMRYGDYLAISAADAGFTKTSQADRKFEQEAFLDGYEGSAKAAMRKLLQEGISAERDATMASGDWPVVLYAPPLDTAFYDNSVLCEYLASKGYLVLSVTAKGEYTRLQSPTIRSVGVQVDDLAFLKHFATQFSRSASVGTIGFSRGGLANLLFAIKNKDVSATVSLDGSIFSEGWLRDAAASPYFAPAELRSDLLMMTKNLRDPQLNPATFYESAIHADRSLIRFDHDVHAYFSSWSLLQDVAAGPSKPGADRYLDFYAEMAAYVGEFLDASLQGAPAFKAHASPRFAHAYKSDPAIRSMDPAEVRFWISEHGIDYVNRVIGDVLRRDDGYLQKIRWRDLTAEAERAIAAGKRADALKILLLADRAVPGWYVVNEMIAVRYLESGDFENAKRHFARALLDNPRSLASRRGLEDLGESPPAAGASVASSSFASYLGTYGEGDRNAKEIFLRDGSLYVGSATWDAPSRLLAYVRERFIVESDDPKANLQLLFEFDDKGLVRGLRTRGMNSGKVSDLLLRKQD